jgi:superfamily II DNA/RNA helicase
MYKTRIKKRNHFKHSNRSRSNTRVQAPDWKKYVNTIENNGTKTKKYVATNTFGDYPLYKELVNRIEHKGYQNPTEIQDKAIMKILDGHNLIGVAGTGTGKTAAFIIPIIQMLLEQKSNRFALIIAPTRELANQINDEFRYMVKGLGLYSTCLIGGSSVRESIKSLQRTNHLVIGTPGRLMDMHRQGFLPFNDFNLLVLDEFDRMLDMCFKQ